jgi:hypothetical protein
LLAKRHLVQSSLLATAQPSVSGRCSRPEESSSREECDLSGTCNRLLQRFRRGVAERVDF